MLTKIFCYYFKINQKGAKIYFLTLDLGTTEYKAGIFNEKGKCIVAYNEEHKALYFPKPGWIEINPDIVLSKCFEVIKICIQKSRISPSQIESICFSQAGQAIMPIDSSGKSLYPFIEGWDSRDCGYKEIIDLWEETLGLRRLTEISGVRCDVTPSLNKLLWIKKNYPEIIKKTYKFVCYGDYITFHLCGETAIDYSMASLTMAFDIQKKKWSDEILSVAQFDKSLFSEAYPSGTVIGKVNKYGALLSGLAEGTKIVTGGHDQSCAGLGGGAYLADGVGFDGLGSVEAIGFVTDEPVDADKLIKNGNWNYCHTVKDKYYLLAVQVAFGNALRWYRDTFNDYEAYISQKTGKNVFDLIIDGASRSKPGANGVYFLPHLRGSSSGDNPPHNYKSKGVIIGLRPEINKDDISRAILEGTCYQSRIVINGIENCGIKVSEMNAAGGPTKSDFWLQLKSNITNKKINVPKINEAGLIGALILSCVGLDVYGSINDAVKNIIKIKKNFEPEGSDIVDYYSKRFELFKDLYPILNQYFNKMFVYNI